MKFINTLVLLVFLLAGCDSNTAESPDLSIAGVNYLGDLPTSVASQYGLFHKHHINASVSFGESGKNNLADLQAGKVDFALMSPTPFLLDKLASKALNSQDNEPVILANLLHSTRMNQILTIREKNIETVSDLAGGKVGLTKGTNAEYLWWLYSVFYQLPLDSVEIVNLPVSELGLALENGELDAIVVWQPWTNQFLNASNGQFVQVEGSHVYSAKWLLVTTRKMVREYPHYCEQILKAYAEAISIIQTDTQNVMQAYNQQVNPDNSSINYEPGLHQLNLNWSLISELHQGIQWAKLHQFPGADVPTDVMSWFAPEPLRAVQPFLVKLPAGSSERNKP